jgi:hypothetical protein
MSTGAILAKPQLNDPIRFAPAVGSEDLTVLNTADLTKNSTRVSRKEPSLDKLASKLTRVFADLRSRKLEAGSEIDLSKERALRSVLEKLQTMDYSNERVKLANGKEVEFDIRSFDASKTVYFYETRKHSSYADFHLAPHERVIERNPSRERYLEYPGDEKVQIGSLTFQDFSGKNLIQVSQTTDSGFSSKSYYLA